MKSVRIKTMRRLLPVLAALPLLFSATAMACPHCGQHYDGYNDRYHNSSGTEGVTFTGSYREKRAELNRLYDEGVPEDDPRVIKLVSALDYLSDQIHQESMKNHMQTYRDRDDDDDHYYHRRSHRHNHSCW